VLVTCDVLEPTLAFFQQRLGFQVDAIFPADNPTTAMISAHGLSLRLVEGGTGGVSDIYLLCGDPRAIADIALGRAMRRAGAFRRRRPADARAADGAAAGAEPRGRAGRLGRRAGRHALPRSGAGPPGRRLHRVAHPHPGGRPGR
jgi:hypothetical protein